MRQRISFLRFISVVLALMVFVAACTGGASTPTATAEPETTTVAMEPTSQASPTPRQGDTRNSVEDEDNDGVLIDNDACPAEGDMGYGVESDGCPTDSDKDGYPDHIDSCINDGDYGFGVESDGCPTDTDADAIPDHLDLCPNDGDYGFGIDGEGCPTDADADGYQDHVDQCPTDGDYGYGLDANGCPVDTDGDGYQDQVDACPNDGDMGYGLDANGCPLSDPELNNDGDGDGVENIADTCPGEGGIVDALGCPLDSDNDGIVDNNDVCPNDGDLGYGVDANGCPLPNPNPDPQPTEEPTQQIQPTDDVQPTDEPTPDSRPSGSQPSVTINVECVSDYNGHIVLTFDNFANYTINGFNPFESGILFDGSVLIPATNQVYATFPNGTYPHGKNDLYYTTDNNAVGQAVVFRYVDVLAVIADLESGGAGNYVYADYTVPDCLPADEPTPEITLPVVNVDTVAINMGINGYCQYFYTQPTAVFELSNPNESDINASFKDQDGNPQSVSIPAGGTQYVYVTPNANGFASIKFDGVANYAEVSNCFTAQLSVTNTVCASDGSVTFTVFNSGPGTVQSGISWQLFGAQTTSGTFDQFGAEMSPNEQFDISGLPDANGFLRFVVPDYNFSYSSTEPCLVIPTPEVTPEDSTTPAISVSAACVSDYNGEITVVLSGFAGYIANGFNPFADGIEFIYEIKLDDGSQIAMNAVIYGDGTHTISYPSENAWRGRQISFTYNTANHYTGAVNGETASIALDNCAPEHVEYTVQVSQSCNAETGINTVTLTATNFITLGRAVTHAGFDNSDIRHYYQFIGTGLAPLNEQYHVGEGVAVYELNTNGKTELMVSYANPAWVNVMAQRALGYTTETFLGDQFVTTALELCGNAEDPIQPYPSVTILSMQCASEYVGEIEISFANFNFYQVNGQEPFIGGFDYYYAIRDADQTLISDTVRYEDGTFIITFTAQLDWRGKTLYFDYQTAQSVVSGTIGMVTHPINVPDCLPQLPPDFGINFTQSCNPETGINTVTFTPVNFSTYEQLWILANANPADAGFDKYLVGTNRELQYFPITADPLTVEVDTNGVSIAAVGYPDPAIINYYIRYLILGAENAGTQPSSMNTTVQIPIDMCGAPPPPAVMPEVKALEPTFTCDNITQELVIDFGLLTPSELQTVLTQYITAFTQEMGNSDGIDVGSMVMMMGIVQGSFMPINYYIHSGDYNPNGAFIQTGIHNPIEAGNLVLRVPYNLLAGGNTFLTYFDFQPLLNYMLDVFEAQMRGEDGSAITSPDFNTVIITIPLEDCNIPEPVAIPATCGEYNGQTVAMFDVSGFGSNLVNYTVNTPNSILSMGNPPTVMVYPDQNGYANISIGNTGFGEITCAISPEVTPEATDAPAPDATISVVSESCITQGSTRMVLRLKNDGPGVIPAGTEFLTNGSVFVLDVTLNPNDTYDMAVFVFNGYGTLQIPAYNFSYTNGISCPPPVVPLQGLQGIGNECSSQFNYPAVILILKNFGPETIPAGTPITTRGFNTEETTLSHDIPVNGELRYSILANQAGFGRIIFPTLGDFWYQNANACPPPPASFGVVETCTVNQQNAPMWRLTVTNNGPSTVSSIITYQTFGASISTGTFSQLIDGNADWIVGSAINFNVMPDAEGRARLFFTNYGFNYTTSGTCPAAQPTPEPTPEVTDVPELTPEATDAPELTPEATPTVEVTPETTEVPGQVTLPTPPSFSVDTVTCSEQKTFSVQVTIGDFNAYLTELGAVLSQILPPEIANTFDISIFGSLPSLGFPVILTHTSPLTNLSPDLSTLAGMTNNTYPFTAGTYTFTITAGAISGFGLPGTGGVPMILPSGVPYYLNMVSPGSFATAIGLAFQPLVDKYNRGETITADDLSTLGSEFSSNMMASLLYTYEVPADIVSSCIGDSGEISLAVEVTAVCDGEARTHTLTFAITGADAIASFLGGLGGSASIPFPYIVNSLTQGQLPFADGTYQVVLNTTLPLSVQYMNPEFINSMFSNIFSGGSPDSSIPQLITKTFEGCGVAGGDLSFPTPPEFTLESATCQGNTIVLTVNFGDSETYIEAVNETLSILLSGFGQSLPFDVSTFVSSIGTMVGNVPVIISHTTPLDVSAMALGSMPANLVGYGTSISGPSGTQTVSIAIMVPPPDGATLYATFINPYKFVQVFTNALQPLVDKFNNGEVITMEDLSSLSSIMSSLIGNGNPSALIAQLLEVVELDEETLGDCLDISLPDLQVAVTEECIGNNNRVTFTISGVTDFKTFLDSLIPGASNSISSLPVQYIFSSGKTGELPFADGDYTVDIDTTGLTSLSVTYLNLEYLSYQLQSSLGSTTGDAPSQTLTKDLTVCSIATPVVTPTEELTPVVTPTEELTPVVTPTEEITPVVTPTEEVTPVVTPTEELTPVVTPTEELTPVVTPTEELTPVVTPTEEVTPVVTPTEELTPVVTPTEELTPVVTPTEEVTPEATSTPEATATPEITPVVTIVVPTLDPLPTIELPEFPTLPVIPTDDDGICGLTLPSLNGLPTIDLSGAGCGVQTERPVQNWSPIAIGGAVCLPEIIYHTNETGDWELFWASANRAPENLSDGVGFIDLAPTRSPDGLWIAFSSNRDGNWEIYAATVDGSTVVRLTDNDSAVDFDPSWSPDGTKLVYESNVDGNWELRMINLLTGEKIRLTDSASPDINPAWHPDGTKIAFQSSRNDGLWQLYELDLLTGAITRLSDGTTDDTDPIYSPDGSRILYKSSTAELRSLAIMTREGAITTNVALTNTNVASGIWSSDGAYIAYEETRIDGSRMIMIYEVATGATRQLTADGVDAFSPAWICESYNVAFTANILGNNDLFVLPAVPMDGAPYDVVTVEPAVGGDANQRDPQNSPAEENASRGGNLPPK